MHMLARRIHPPLCSTLDLWADRAWVFRFGASRAVLAAPNRRPLTAEAPTATTRCCAPTSMAATLSTRRGPDEEHQTELADLDLVAVGQHRRGHRFTVDIGAVEAADVNDLEFAVVPSELGVPAADGDLVEEDVAAGMPASGCDGLIQQEPRSGVGATLHDKQGRAARQPFDFPHPRLGGASGRSIELAGEVGAETGGGVPGVL